MTNFNSSKEGLKRTGEKVQYLRKLRGFSQEELAKKMGYSNRSSIARIENGTTDIPVKQIMKLSEILGCAPAYLVGTPEEILRINPANDYMREKDLEFGRTYYTDWENNKIVMDNDAYHREHVTKKEFIELFDRLSDEQIEVVMNMMKALVK